MKIYRVSVLIIDHDGVGAAGIKTEMENVRYPNRCISPRVLGIEEADIGEWDDSHPLNRKGADPGSYFEGDIDAKLERFFTAEGELAAEFNLASIDYGIHDCRDRWWGRNRHGELQVWYDKPETEDDLDDYDHCYHIEGVYDETETHTIFLVHDGFGGSDYRLFRRNQEVTEMATWSSES